ncbi:MAG: KH domain-containing protein [Candidatus Bathyarchaeia archaeon]
MSSNLRMKIPEERVGVLIGPKGSFKRKIEKLCNVNLVVSSDTGVVEFEPSSAPSDPTAIFKLQNVISAIGHGFSSTKALCLLEDDVLFEIIDLRDYVGRSKADLERLMGRLIGRSGKARRILEENTDTHISIYGHTVAIIGRPKEVEVARSAIQRLIGGSEHRTVYQYLSRVRRELKKEKLKLWEEQG